MIFRKSVPADINAILEIIKQAQHYFKENNIDQWQNNYPNYETIQEDIASENSYVLEKNNTVIATSAIVFTGESTYEKIYEGKWLTDNKYATIHRIAVREYYKGQGISAEVISETEKLCHEKGFNSIRVDTHEDNKSMQKMLSKNGFEYCGIIYLSDGNKRIAFEKVLRN